jgi:hypothetical protein
MLTKFTSLVASVGLAQELTFSGTTANDESYPTALSRNCAVMCEGPILAAVQDTKVFPDDSKEFVDRPMNKSPEAIQAAFLLLTPE